MMAKHPRPDENIKINKRVLIRTYRQFKAIPDKIFVCRDFGTISKFRERYLNTLIVLDLIEKIEVMYNGGNGSRNRAIGYRLLNSHSKPNTK